MARTLWPHGSPARPPGEVVGRTPPGVVGHTFTTAVFGIAAFAQPAIGRAYTAGHADMVDLYNDVSGGPLIATAATGVLLSFGLILYGVAVARSGLAPRPAGSALVVGGPLFAIVGLVLANFVQSIGVALLAVGTIWIASASPRGRVENAHARSSADRHPASPVPRPAVRQPGPRVSQDVVGVRHTESRSYTLFSTLRPGRPSDDRA